MADVASSLKNWSSTPASNNPTSATTIGTGLAPNLQQIQATLRNELGARSSAVTAAASTDLGAKDEGTVLVFNAVGTVAITSFGTVSAGIKKLVTFSVTGGSLSITHNATSMILPGSSNITVTTGASLLAESLGSGNWKIHWYANQDGSSILGVTPAQLQNQTYLTFTTGGTSTAYTLTPTPALAALTTGHRFNVIPNATAGATPTLAISGLTAKSIKQYNVVGTKIAVDSNSFVSGNIYDIQYDGTDYVALNPTKPAATLGTVQASTSGTAITFGSIPSWVKRITVNFSGVSTSGTNNLLITIGDSGGLETSGYLSAAWSTSAVSGVNGTAAFVLTSGVAAATVMHGSAVLTLLDASTNTWSMTANIGYSNAASVQVSAGSKSLSDVLTQLSVTTSGGVDTFDAGKINIYYD